MEIEESILLGLLAEQLDQQTGEFVNRLTKLGYFSIGVCGITFMLHPDFKHINCMDSVVFDNLKQFKRWCKLQNKGVVYGGFDLGK